FSLFLPQGSYVVAAHNDWVQGHLIIALISYGLMAVAAVYARLVLYFERYLHQPATEQRKRPVLYLALESMPPLLTQEKLLFHFIRFGFAALTLAMVSGSFVSAMLTQQWFPLDHKTVFTVLSWLTFGALLVGRRLYGWRGRAAVRAPLLGFILLLLAYSGSHFVLDVLLKRGSIGYVIFLDRGRCGADDSLAHHLLQQTPSTGPTIAQQSKSSARQRANGALRALWYLSATVRGINEQSAHLVQFRARQTGSPTLTYASTLFSG